MRRIDRAGELVRWLGMVYERKTILSILNDDAQYCFARWGLS